MMNPTKANPFAGKAKSGEDYKTDIPSQDKHEARIVAMIDLGTHDEQFGLEAPKPVHSVYLVYELDEEMTGMKGVRHVVAQKYSLSWHEKANLRRLAEAVLNEGAKFSTEANIDYGDLLGQACEVQITHTAKTTEKGERKYCKISAVGAVSKKQKPRVFAATRPLTVWTIGEDVGELPDWLPRLFGEPIADVIDRCHELSDRRTQEAPDAPNSAEETPF